MLIWHEADKVKPEYGVTVLGHYHCEFCARNESHAHTAVEQPINPGNFDTVTYWKGDPNHPFERFKIDHWSVSRITHWTYIPIPIFDANGGHVADIYKPKGLD